MSLLLKSVESDSFRLLFVKNDKRDSHTVTLFRKGKSKSLLVTL